VITSTTSMCEEDEGRCVSVSDYSSRIEERVCGKVRLRRHSPVHMHVVVFGWFDIGTVR
jgi:hypothetical protein